MLKNPDIIKKTNRSTSGSVILTNTIWNIAGQFVPIVAAVIVWPMLIEKLGLERFGILGLAWAIAGYSSLFDLGLSRVLTKIIAERVETEKENELPQIISTSLIIIVIMGIIGAVFVALISKWLVSDIIKIDLNIRSEVITSFYVLAVSIPITILTIGFKGILEARHQFGLINIIRIPAGVFTFLGPLLVLNISQSLVGVVLVLVLVKLLVLLIYLVFSISNLSSLFKKPKFSYKCIPDLIRLGSWMTVTNVVGPIMVYADRFLIAAVLSVSATAYYITPYTVVTKACILASAMTGVFFPAFAQFYNRDKQRVIELFSANLKLVFAVMFPLMLLVIIFGEKAISIWLGPDFAKESTIVLQWLAVGVLLNSAASVPFSFLHGIGKPDITAKLHLAELPLYLFILLICLKYYGIKGAALAWTARIVLDTALMFILTSRQYPELKSTIYNSTIYISLGTIILLLGFTVNSLSIKLIFFLLSILLFAVLMWLVFMSREEKIFIRKYFKYVSIKAA